MATNSRNAGLRKRFLVAMKNFETERERAACDLAERLFFELDKRGNHYSLCRKIGDHARRDNLTFDEVEHTLERWKLEGLMGC